MRDYKHLLGRQEHFFDEVAIDRELEGRRVMVTGAGGSIGSALVRRLLESGVEFVGLVGHSELPIFNLWNTLPPEDRSRAARLIESVCNIKRMRRIIDIWRPDIIFHTAAHKHVGLMETHPAEAFKNNTEGTIALAKIALKSESVRRFVFISTDKAAQPTSVMGASKRLAEAALRADFSPFAVSCRFGNVLGSSGSLVEIVERKLALKEPITVNDPDMRRYFITAKEAVGLVLTAGLLRTGDMYSLEMGGLVSILHVLARLCPPNTHFVNGQKGSGEKVDEVLLCQGEYFRPTDDAAIREIVTPAVPGIHEALERVRANPHSIVEEARNL